MVVPGPIGPASIEDANAETKPPGLREEISSELKSYELRVRSYYENCKF